MGLYDHITCEYPLSSPSNSFQTKDTPAQWCEDYKIDADGNLWFLEKEREFHKDESIPIVGFRMDTIKEGWVKCDTFRGEIVFYTGSHDDWWEYSALFNDGKLIDLRPIHEGVNLHNNV